MKNVLVKVVLTSVVALGLCELTGCTPGNNVAGSTAAGAIAGGLLGTAIFHNQVAGAIGGALVGGVIGNRIGNYMDAQDKANMQSAIVNTPVGQQATWTNQNGPNGQPVTYSVRPVQNYTSASSHRYCREYQTTVTVNGKAQSAYGKACRQPDGSWRIVS